LARLAADDFSSAEASLKRALLLFPEYYDALDRLGSEYVQRGESRSAIPLLVRALEVNRRGWHAFYSLGTALGELGQLDEAISAMRHAVELNPQSPNANVRLGLLLARDPKTYDQAVAAFVRTTSLAGRDLPDAYFYLASLYTKQERFTEAAGALQSYVDALPRADAKQKEQYRKAIEQLRSKAAQKKP
jgi:tetratricopeptide (TPR) repeat protein